MISVSKGFLGDIPSLTPRQLLNIDQDSQKFYSSNSRVSVIHLNAVFFRKLGEILMLSLVCCDEILNSRSTEEVLLFKTKFFSLLGRVIRVQNGSDVLRLLPLFNGSVIITLIKLFE